MTSSAPPILLPRALIFMASLWLIGSWFVAMGFPPPLHPSSASYEPGVRMMLLSVATGLLVGWPLLRLSQSATRYPMRQTILDLLVLLAMVQVVLWPLRLVTTWGPARTAAIDATLAAWLIIVGVLVASVTQANRRGPRHLAMIVCLAMCLLGPALGLLQGTSSQPESIITVFSPLSMLRVLADGGGAPVQLGRWVTISFTGLFGIAAWWVLGCTRPGAPAGDSSEDASTDTAEPDSKA